MVTPRGFKRQIAKEAKGWVEKEIVSPEQASAICQEYDVDLAKAGDQSFGYNILVVLGLLFLALSLITLIGANWDTIPRALRMSVLVLTTLAVHGAGLRYFLQGKQSWAVNLFFLGNFCYGASIALIAQIYHLGEHMPDGIFIWALGALPFALLCKSPLLSIQTIALAMIWFYTEASLGFYPALFPLFIVASIWVMHSSTYNKLLFAQVVLSVVVWFEYSLAKFWHDGRFYDFHAEHLVVSASLSFFAFFLGAFLSRHSSTAYQIYGATLSDWSLRVMVIAGLALSFYESWSGLQTVVWDNGYSMLVFCAVLTGMAGWCAMKADQLQLFAYSQIAFVAVGLSVLLFDSYAAPIYFQILTNVALIGVGIRLIGAGVQSGSSRQFFSGIGLILFMAMLRYVDLVGSYVGGAALFLLFALIMLGSAWAWKRIQSKSNPQGEGQ